MPRPCNQSFSIQFSMIFMHSKTEPQKAYAKALQPHQNDPVFGFIMEPKTESDGGPCDGPYVVKTMKKMYAKSRNDINIISL